MRKTSGLPTALAAALLSAACADPIGSERPDETEISSVERVSGESFQGYIGFPLIDSVRVRVRNGAGGPVSGAAVDFSVSAGGGSVHPSSATTDAAGVASALWVLGLAEGENRLTAAAGKQGSTVTFSAVARAAPAASITAVSGTSAQVPIGCSVVDPLRVRVTTGAGQPVANLPVLFVPAGTAASEGELAMTDGDGYAALNWRLRESQQEVLARIPTTTQASATFQLTGLPVAPQGFATVGNQIIGPDCEPHRFVGVARPGLQWWPDDAYLKDPQAAAREFQAMKEWGANVVRIPLYQRFWLRDFVYQETTYTKEAYQALVQSIVESATSAGLAVMLDLHTSDRGDPNFPAEWFEIQQMADLAHSIHFWEQVAAAYKDHGSVLFQLYTEPNQISWDVWRNGGMIPGGQTLEGTNESNGIAFEAAGMQDLYDAVRRAGASNLVVVNGQHWGYDLSGVPEYAIDGYNIVYAAHAYDWPDKQPDVWWRDFGSVSQIYPVLISEFGDYRCNEGGYYDSVLDFADRHGLSWIAWAWWAPPPELQDLICKFPALITSWETFAPSPSGKVVRARMQSYR